MPSLHIDTNLPIASIPPNFKVKTCELMADIFEAPLNFCIVNINAERDIYWYGLNGPFVLAVLKIISGSGKINPEQNIGYAEKFVKHISDALKIPNENISISFVEQEAANVTVFNTTVLDYLQNKN